MTNFNAKRFYNYFLNSKDVFISSDEIALIKEQDLYLYLLCKGCNYPISDEEKLLSLVKGQALYEVYKKEVVDVINAFEEKGVDYRLIKGLGISITYPSPFTRLMGDVDLLVHKSEFDKATFTLNGLGYTALNFSSESKDITFCKVGAPSIELHRDIYDFSDLENYEGYYDLLELLWEEVDYICIDGTKIKVPKPLNHMKYILIHFYKHFIGNGCGVRFLLDVHYFGEKHKIDFCDLESYFKLGAMKKFTSLIKAMIEMNFKFFEIVTTKIDASRIEEVKLVAQYLLFDGIFGSCDKNHIQNSRVSLYHKARKKSYFNLIQVILLPSSEKLGENFFYAKQNKFLLPVAWVHRILNFVFGKRSLKEKLFFLTNNNELLSKKEDVLKTLGF